MFQYLLDLYTDTKKGLQYTDSYVVTKRKTDKNQSRQDDSTVCIPRWAVGRWCMEVKPKVEESVQGTENE